MRTPFTDDRGGATADVALLLTLLNPLPCPTAVRWRGGASGRGLHVVRSDTDDNTRVCLLAHGGHIKTAARGDVALSEFLDKALADLSACVWIT